MAEPSKPKKSSRFLEIGTLNVRRSVRDEFDFHLEMTVRELVKAGMKAREARAEARRRFGRIDRYRSACQQIGYRRRQISRRGETMSNLQQDLKLALRALRRSPLFTTVALMTLALGIGANTAVFTVVNTVVLQPLPYDEPERIVALWTERTDSGETDAFSIPEYRDFEAQTDTLAELGFWVHWSMDITHGDEPERVQSVRVSSNMLGILGVEPLNGRLFRPEEGEPGNDHVALLSHGLWQRRFGGDEALVGQTIELDGNPHTVIGVMPAGFRFPYEDEYGAGFWTPIAHDPEESNRFSRWLNLVARLDDGVEISQATTEVETIAARLAQEYPRSNAGWTFRLAPMHKSVVGNQTRTALWILYAVVAFVLLIACANLANLFLARMESRQREIAVRAALGASRARLLRELLAESVLLALSGGLLGLLMARWGMSFFIALIPTQIPRLDEIGFDGSVLTFALLVSAATGILFGLLPAYHASRGDLQETLKASGSRSTSSGRHRFRAALVVAEVAVALVLLVGAGLLLRSFSLLIGEERGFDAERVLTFEVSPSSFYEDAAGRYGFYRDLVRGLQALPETRVAGGNTSPPLSGVDWTTTFTVAGRALPAPGQEPTAQFNVVTPDYFRALDVPLLRGRFFTEDDARSRPRVVIVNESLAVRHFAEEDPIGRQIYIGARVGGDDESSDAPGLEVVGIVGDMRKFGLDREPPPELYISYAQSPPHFMYFVVQTHGNPLGVVDAMRAQVRQVNANVAVDDLATMDELLSSSVAEPRFNTMLLGSFAVLALVLATLGIYGIVSYSATERTREIGVRMALGAQSGDVFKMMVGQGIMLTGAGLALGVVASLAMTRLMGGLLYRVTTTDPITFAGVSVLLAGVAVLAAYLPARRATRVDPLVALREE